MPAPSGVRNAGRRRVSLSRLCGGRARAGCVRMPLLSLMVARVMLRRSAAARERTLPGCLGRGTFPAFPGCRLGQWDDIRGFVCPAPTALPVASQSAASPAIFCAPRVRWAAGELPRVRRAPFRQASSEPDMRLSPHPALLCHYTAAVFGRCRHSRSQPTFGHAVHKRKV